MPVVNCPIDIPDGWEFVRYGVPKHGEYFIAYGGEPSPVSVCHDFNSEWIVIRRARPDLKVGDWARVNRIGITFHGMRGVVQQSHKDGDHLVQFGNRGSGWIAGELLTKQIRTVEPYTIDQCIAEAAKRGRHVQCGSKSTLIESIHIAGVTLSCPSIGFVSYVEAAKSLTWSSGEAFGTETWEDAE